jgi:hypothetical protein
VVFLCVNTVLGFDLFSACEAGVVAHSIRKKNGKPEFPS